jgi:hypothetical protein
LRRQPGVELALEQTANVLRAQGTEANVPDLRVNVVTDVELV